MSNLRKITPFMSFYCWYTPYPAPNFHRHNFSPSLIYCILLLNWYSKLSINIKNEGYWQTKIWTPSIITTPNIKRALISTQNPTQKVKVDLSLLLLMYYLQIIGILHGGIPWALKTFLNDPWSRNESWQFICWPHYTSKYVNFE